MPVNSTKDISVEQNICTSSIDWLQERRNSTTLTCSEIAWCHSKEWMLSKGIFSHRTKGFFSVCGVKARAQHKHLDRKTQPIINQPEVGILGFIVAQSKTGWRWMLQAKAEPGNVGVVQLAPSVQATYSNYSRKHGGKATPYLTHFLDKEELFLSDTLQSEQGTRFLHKFNRNTVCVADTEPVNKQFRWFDSSHVQTAIRTDFALNTDARSVIVTAPWQLIAMHGTPFAQVQHKESGWDDMYASYTTKPDKNHLSEIHQCTQSLRQTVALETEVCMIDELLDWELDYKGITPRHESKSVSLRFYEIFAPEREKTNWSQPFTLAPVNDLVILFCQKRKGVLRFLLRPSIEIGLTEGVELGPSYQKGLQSVMSGSIQKLVDKGDFKTLIRVSQSDEGGRFMQTRVDYAICRLKNHASAIEDDSNGFWVTLAELEVLCQQPKKLTNEARSVISLLLAHA